MLLYRYKYIFCFSVIKEADIPNTTEIQNKKRNKSSKQYECFDCDFHTARLDQLKCHIKKTHLFPNVSPCSLKKLFLKCEEYGYRNGFLNDLIRHIAQHVDKTNSLSCKLCEYKTIYLSRFKQHLKRHTKIPSHTCDICSHSVSSSSDLKKHMRKHTGEKPFSCSLCEYSASSSTSLRMHMSKHTGDRPFGCDHCDYKTARRGDLTSHMLSHSKEKPYVCPCGFKTARAAHLRRHMEIHNIRNRPYACTFCNSYFTRLDDLKKHSKTHTGMRNHHCLYCNYQADTRNTLGKHLRRKHFGNKELKSNIVDNLRTHCPYCDYKANTARGLGVHIKRKHDTSLDTNIIGRAHFLCSPYKLYFVCFHCEYHTWHLNSLRCHIVTEHNGGNWKSG